MALHYFMSTHWEFKNNKFLGLSKCLNEEDESSFQFDNFITADIKSYFINCMYGTMGLRIYILRKYDKIFVE